MDFGRTLRLGAVAALAVIVPLGACDNGGAGPGEAKHRAFYMGMTPWAYDFTVAARDYTYARLAERTDLIAHHFDDGIPWPEALAGKPYHLNVENNLQERVGRLRPGDKTYLALSALAHDRKSLAGYWGAESNMEMPSGWKDKKFDDPDVIQAYTNFLRDLIKRFDPDYIAFAVEVNAAFPENDPNLPAFETFITEVRSTIKKENPNVPVFLSFVIGGNDAEGTRRINLAKRFLKYSDYMAVSTYPFLEAAGGLTGDADPGNLPRNWFSQMRDLAPEKPYAVAETGFIAEDLVMKTYGINIKGNATWQAQYVRFLLEEADQLGAVFVVYWCVRDYDQAWNRMKELGYDEFYKMWRDIGLYDGDGKARRSRDVWDSWFGASRN